MGIPQPILDLGVDALRFVYKHSIFYPLPKEWVHRKGIICVTYPFIHLFWPSFLKFSQTSRQIAQGIDVKFGACILFIGHVRHDKLWVTLHWMFTVELHPLRWLILVMLFRIPALICAISDLTPIGHVGGGATISILFYFLCISSPGIDLVFLTHWWLPS